MSDTGSGIPIELQERIFEPFVTGDLPGKRKEGIGLGLSITRRLVALHSGSITLDSQPDQGSTFHVYLPLPGLNYVSTKEVNLEGSSTIIVAFQYKNTTFNDSQTLPEKRLRCTLVREYRRYRSRPPIWQAGCSGMGFGKCPARRLVDRSKVAQLFQVLQSAFAAFSGKYWGQKLTGGDRVTNIILKPAGKQTFQHILDLLPQTAQHGEIWIIDDDPQALKYYQTLISDSLAEFLVRGICGGVEALRLLTESTPDLVILDLMMPDVDGFQVLEHLRSNLKTASIPVIIITGKILSFEDVKRLDPL